MATLIMIAVAVLCTVVILYFVGLPLFVAIGRLVQYLLWKRDLKRIAAMYGSQTPDRTGSDKRSRL